MENILLYIGHGRALELFLGFYKVVLAVSIALSSIGQRVPALSDLAWHYSSYALAAPFAIIGALQLSGLVLNAKGYEFSWILRAGAASSAMLVWIAIIIKSSWLGEPTLMIPIAVSALPASAFLVYKAWHRLPIPGAAGLV